MRTNCSYLLEGWINNVTRNTVVLIDAHANQTALSISPRIADTLFQFVNRRVVAAVEQRKRLDKCHRIIVIS